MNLIKNIIIVLFHPAFISSPLSLLLTLKLFKIKLNQRQAILATFVSVLLSQYILGSYGIIFMKKISLLSNKNMYLLADYLLPFLGIVIFVKIIFLITLKKSLVLGFIYWIFTAILTSVLFIPYILLTCGLFGCPGLH